jgi:hypothetical protein
MHVHDVIRNGLSVVDRSARHVKVPPIDRRLLADLTADTLLQIGNEFLNEFLTENLRLMPPILNELLIIPDTIAHTSSPAPTNLMIPDRANRRDSPLHTRTSCLEEFLPLTTLVSSKE